jgi:hypothetical protein
VPGLPVGFAALPRNHRLNDREPNGNVQPLAGVIPVSLAAASSGESAGTDVRRPRPGAAPARYDLLPMTVNCTV